MTITAQFMGFIDLPLFEAPYTVPHIGPTGPDWQGSYNFQPSMFDVAPLSRRAFGNFGATSRNDLFGWKFDYQACRTWSRMPESGDGTLGFFQWKGTTGIGCKVVASTGTFYPYIQNFPPIAANADVSVDFVAQPAKSFYIGTTNNVAPLYDNYPLEVAENVVNTTFKTLSLYVSQLQNTVKAYMIETDQLYAIAQGGSLPSSVQMQQCTWFLSSFCENRWGPIKGPAVNTLYVGPRGSVTADALRVGYFAFDLFGNLSSFGLDDFVFGGGQGFIAAGFQLKAIEFARWNAVTASPYGFTGILKTDGQGPTGGTYEIVHLSSDASTWYVIRLTGQNANARAQVAALALTGTVKIDRLGFLWFQSNAVPSNNQRVFNAYAIAFNFAPRFRSLNYPPLDLPCYNPCSASILDANPPKEEF